MRPLSAISIVLLATALHALNDGRWKSSVITKGLAILGGFGGTITIAQRFLSVTPRLFHTQPMSTLTAACCVFLGGSYVLKTSRHSLSRTAAELLALSVAGICYTELLALLYEFSFLRTSAHPVSMGPLSSAVLGLLSLGGLFVRPSGMVFEELCGNNLGGAMARRLFPQVLIGVPLIGWIRLEGQLHGLYPAEFGVALVVAGGILLMFGIIWFNARSLNRSNAARELLDEYNRGLAAIVNSSSDAILSKDMNGIIRSWNVAAEKLYGYSAHEIVGKSVSTIIPINLQSDASSILNEIGSGLRVARADTVRRRKDGTLVHVSLLISPVWDAEGKIIGASSVAHDITEQRRIELELAKSRIRVEEQRLLLKSVLDSVSDGLVAIDKDGQFLLWNAAAKRIVRRDAEDVSPEQWTAHYGLFLEDKSTPYPMERHPAQVALRGQSSSDIMFMHSSWSDRGLFAEVDANPLRAPNGVIQGAVMAFRDVTKRRESEEVLRQSEERFSKAFTFSPIPITISTVEDGQYVDANPAFLEMVGYTADELVGRTSEQIGIWESPERRKELLVAAAATVNVRQFPTKFRTKNGETRDVEIFADEIHLNGQRCLIAAIIDITNSKSLEAQYRQAQKMEAVGRMAGGIAHDFNNLLAVILGYGDLALSKLPPADPNADYINKMMKASNRATDLTRQLLTFSRQQVVQLTVVNLNEVIRSFHDMVKRVVREDVELRLVLGNDLAAVTADRGQLEQVIMNLVVNARDAIAGEGRIVVETANITLDESSAHQLDPNLRPGRFVTLSVSDTGSGMSAETVSRIFDPFFTTKPVGKGTGLGLPTVYGVVKQCGGHIWVASEKGMGTTFRIYLPVAENSAPEEFVLEEAAFEEGQETVLLVEDDENLRSLTAELLQSAGYKVLQAENGESALSLVMSHDGKPDLLLTDMIMPGMVGTTLAKAVRRRCKGIKVVYMSGHTANLLEDQRPEEGSAFLQKPFTRVKLLAQIRAALTA